MINNSSVHVFTEVRLHVHTFSKDLLGIEDIIMWEDLMQIHSQPLQTTICWYVCMYVSVHVYVHLSICLCLYACIYVCMYVCKNVACMYAFEYLSMSVFM